MISSVAVKSPSVSVSVCARACVCACTCVCKAGSSMGLTELVISGSKSECVCRGDVHFHSLLLLLLLPELEQKGWGSYPLLSCQHCLGIYYNNLLGIGNGLLPLLCSSAWNLNWSLLKAKPHIAKNS